MEEYLDAKHKCGSDHIQAKRDKAEKQRRWRMVRRQKVEAEERAKAREESNARREEWDAIERLLNE